MTMPISPPDEQTITDAYIYLLARALVIRQERRDLQEPGVGYNVIKYNPLGSADFVNPNFDVAYLEAWIAVDERAPAVLEVPSISGRYYTAQVLDEWGEVIVNINERTFPSQPYGKYVLLAPGSHAALPGDAAPIYLHSNKAKLLARVELRGDPAGAVAFQKQFTLRSLGTPVVAKAPAVPDFDNKSQIGVQIFEDTTAVIASALDVSPVAAEMQQKVRAVAEYVADDTGARSAVDKLLRGTVIPAFQEYVFTRSAPERNRWVGAGETGNYGRNYRMRTTANYAGIWANTPSEVIYFASTRDADGRPLNGATQYVMHFPADQLPEGVVNGYWSIILVGVPDYRVVGNPLNRYNLNSYSTLAKELDGSLKIAIGPTAVPGIADSNWLPSPPDKPFSLTFRTYVPKDVVRQKWAPPAVTPIGVASLAAG